MPCRCGDYHGHALPMRCTDALCQRTGSRRPFAPQLIAMPTRDLAEHCLCAVVLGRCRATHNRRSALLCQAFATLVCSKPCRCLADLALPQRRFAQLLLCLAPLGVAAAEHCGQCRAQPLHLVAMPTLCAAMPRLCASERGRCRALRCHCPALPCFAVAPLPVAVPPRCRAQRSMPCPAPALRRRASPLRCLSEPSPRAAGQCHAAATLCFATAMQLTAMPPPRYPR